MTPLTEQQKTEIRQEMVSWKFGIPCRFLSNGQSLNIITGELIPKGTNVIYHFVYWGFTRETANKIANWLGAKAVFSE